MRRALPPALLCAHARLHLPALGQPQRLTIGHTNCGPSPAWRLALAELVEEVSGKVTYFACDRWVGGDLQESNWDFWWLRARPWGQG